MKNAIQRFGKFLSAMVMPNIGAFIAWGLITALFIPAGWLPNESLATMVGPILSYLLPVLIGYQGGKMVGGDRGAITGAIATMGVIAGAPDQPMLMGAMIMGPVGGAVIKAFDKSIHNKVKAGFEMLVNNFSVGILGMILAIIGFYLIGPFMAAVLAVLSVGVEVLINNNLLPITSIFVEPAKVLFLNNAINHGLFTPLGTEQVAEAGKSIMYMLEANPGPGLGVLLAYWMFSKDKATKSSAPGAVIIHFFGGIHEIYFPYVLMNPVIIIAPIAGSAAAIFFYLMTGAGLVGPAAPGSIIAFLAVAPKGETLIVLIGVLIAAAVSLLVAAPIVKMSGSKSLDDASAKMKEMKAESKGQTAEIKADGTISKIVFACDAGMGSSAMGATKFRNRIADLGLNITVTNTSVDNVPGDADIVVCQQVLADRAKASAPQAQLITIGNFLADSALDNLYITLSQIGNEKPEIISFKNIILGLKSETKEQAIERAGGLLNALGYVDASYIDAMQERERLVTTYMGLGVAIPHGTAEAKENVKNSGIVVLQYPEGVDFGDEKAYLVFGIAGVNDEHLEILSKIAETVDDEKLLKVLSTTNSIDDVLNILK